MAFYLLLVKETGIKGQQPTQPFKKRPSEGFK
jgi:hypothetical protein